MVSDAGDPMRLRSMVVLGPIVAGLLGIGGIAQAGYAEMSLTRSPDHGPRRTVIEVHGTGCADNGRRYDSAAITLYYTRDNRKVNLFEQVPLSDDGTFNGTLTVPDNAPPGGYTVGGLCTQGDAVFDVGDLPFTVDGPPPSPSPSSSVQPTASATPRPAPKPVQVRAAPPSPRPLRAVSPRASSLPAVRRTTPPTAAPSLAPARVAAPSVQVAAYGSHRDAATLVALALLALNGTLLRWVRRPAEA